MGPGVGLEAGLWPGQFTEQSRVDEQPEVPVDGAQAHPRRSADDQSVDFLGSGVRLDAPDRLEHRVARSGQPESPVPQCDLGALDARWARIVRCPSNSHLRDDSHFQQPARTKSRYERSLSVSRSDATRSWRSAPRARPNAWPSTRGPPRASARSGGLLAARTRGSSTMRAHSSLTLRRGKRRRDELPASIDRRGGRNPGTFNGTGGSAPARRASPHPICATRYASL
jgi:hypothetical protein